MMSSGCCCMSQDLHSKRHNCTARNGPHTHQIVSCYSIFTLIHMSYNKKLINRAGKIQVDHVSEKGCT